MIRFVKQMKKIAAFLEKIIPIKDSSLVRFLKFMNDLFLILSAVSVIAALGFLVYDIKNEANNIKESIQVNKEYKKLYESFKVEVIKDYQAENPEEDMPSDYSLSDYREKWSPLFNEMEEKQMDCYSFYGGEGEYLGTPISFDDIDEGIEELTNTINNSGGWFNNYMDYMGYWILLGVFVGFPFCVLYYKINRIKLNKLSE
jgi:hypothetical protein